MVDFLKIEIEKTKGFQRVRIKVSSLLVSDLPESGPVPSPPAGGDLGLDEGPWQCGERGTEAGAGGPKDKLENPTIKEKADLKTRNGVDQVVVPFSWISFPECPARNTRDQNGFVKTFVTSFIPGLCHAKWCHERDKICEVSVELKSKAKRTQFWQMYG